MRFSFSLFQFVVVQVEKAAFSISSVTVIPTTSNLQFVHFIFLLPNTPLKKDPFPALMFSLAVKNQIVEVFLRLFCTEQQSWWHTSCATACSRSNFTTILVKNFFGVDNCQLSAIQL